MVTAHLPPLSHDGPRLSDQQEGGQSGHLPDLEREKRFVKNRNSFPGLFLVSESCACFYVDQNQIPQIRFSCIVFAHLGVDSGGGVSYRDVSYVCPDIVHNA